MKCNINKTSEEIIKTLKIREKNNLHNSRICHGNIHTLFSDKKSLDFNEIAKIQNKKINIISYLQIFIEAPTDKVEKVKEGTSNRLSL